MARDMESLPSILMTLLFLLFPCMERPKPEYMRKLTMKAPRLKEKTKIMSPNNTNKGRSSYSSVFRNAPLSVLSSPYKCHLFSPSLIFIISILELMSHRMSDCKAT